MHPENREHKTELNQKRDFIIEKLFPHVQEILMDYFTSRDFTIEHKSRLDIVLSADEQINRFLVDHLHQEFPDAKFLAEESKKDADKPHIVSLEEAKQIRKGLFVIDPLDGTGDFAAGDPNFAVSIAYVEEGEPTLCAILVPATGEVFWTSADEQQAFVRRKGKEGIVEQPVQVSSTSTLSEARLHTEWSGDAEKRKGTAEWLRQNITRLRFVLIKGSTVNDIAAVAQGQADGFFVTGTKPWDTAAASLLIQKAGGKISSLDGSEYTIFQPNILASNGVLHTALEAITPKE